MVTDVTWSRGWIVVRCLPVCLLAWLLLLLAGCWLDACLSGRLGQAVRLLVPSSRGLRSWWCMAVAWLGGWLMA